MALKFPLRYPLRSLIETEADVVPLRADVTGTLEKSQRPWLKLLPDWIVGEGVMLDRHIREGRFQRSLSLIAGLSSVLAGMEVSTEHVRGSYSQRIMYSPVILSPLLFGAGVWGAFSKRAARTVLPVISLITIVDGVIGFAFHIRGIHRKPGGWSFVIFDLVMGPPVLAPLLFTISGYLGLLASLLRPEEDPPGVLLANRVPGLSSRRSGWLRLLPRTVGKDVRLVEEHVREGRFQQQLAAATAVSAVLSGFEALYSHYKNNFQYGVQWTPLILTPFLVVAGVGAIWNRAMARVMLPIVSILALIDGAVGTFFHIRGIMRRPGGLKYSLYQLVYGPPAFAPLLFAASGFLGVLASLLRRAE